MFDGRSLAPIRGAWKQNRAKFFLRRGGWQRVLAVSGGIVAAKAQAPLDWRLSFLNRKPARAARDKVIRWNCERVLSLTARGSDRTAAALCGVRLAGWAVRPSKSTKNVAAAHLSRADSASVSQSDASMLAWASKCQSAPKFDDRPPITFERRVLAVARAVGAETGRARVV